MNFSDAMRKATADLRQGGVSDPEREAQYILQWATGKDWGYWVAWGGSLTAEAWRITQKAIQRRVAGEPWAYITGHREFFGLDLWVNPSVLIPRPETELLVQWVLDEMDQEPWRVVDVGCGSGAIALALRSRRPRWTLYGVDVSMASVATAYQNGERLGLTINWMLSDLLAMVPKPVDAIVANLPYVDPASEEVSPETRYEPKVALFADDQGMRAIRRLIEQAPNWLSPKGQIFLECGWDQAATITELLHTCGFDQPRVRKDYAGHDRMLAAKLNPY